MVGHKSPTGPQTRNVIDGPAKVRVESKDFEMLSGLRGLAALLVLVHHINVRGYLCDYRGLEELRVFSVGAFFVLSSFLLCVRRLPFPTKIPQLFHASAHKMALSFVH
jgi:hypothetical protein